MAATTSSSRPDRDLFSERPGRADLQSSMLHSHHYKQSSHLPRGLYLTICAIFHVPTSENDRCIIGKCVLGVIVLVSCLYGGFDIVFTIYDIKSSRTKQTVTTGLFNMFITFIWCALGIYALRLGRRILKSASFVNSLRLHSKTVFKIPATVLIVILATAAIAICNYKAYGVFWNMTRCDDVNLPSVVCRILYISRIFQTTVVLIFNCCVASAVLSICRTHTIGVRRFIRALENDGHTCEMKHRQRFQKLQFAASHNLSEMYLPEQCYRADDEDDIDSLDGRDDDKATLLHTYLPSGNSEAVVSSTTETDRRVSFDTPPEESRASKRPSSSDGHILSKDDILFSYWKLASRMRMTSQVLQRWTASWITFTLLWLLKWIIAWLSHPAQYLEIALFILPLLMIIIICSGYSEANGEAAKIIWSITPLQDRLDMIKTLPNVQMGMTLYNARIEYSSILTVVGAIGLALSSRMILDEFLPPSPHS